MIVSTFAIDLAAMIRSNAGAAVSSNRAIIPFKCVRWVPRSRRAVLVVSTATFSVAVSNDLPGCCSRTQLSDGALRATEKPFR